MPQASTIQGGDSEERASIDQAMPVPQTISQGRSLVNRTVSEPTPIVSNLPDPRKEGSRFLDHLDTQAASPKQPEVQDPNSVVARLTSGTSGTVARNMADAIHRPAQLPANPQATTTSSVSHRPKVPSQATSGRSPNGA